MIFIPFFELFVFREPLWLCWRTFTVVNDEFSVASLSMFASKARAYPSEAPLLTQGRLLGPVP
jgi:hypothetical protein